MGNRRGRTRAERSRVRRVARADARSQLCRVVQQIATQPASDLALAGLATALSYLVLTGYDFSALKYAGAQVRRTTVLLTSFIAYALGNTVGLGVLTGGAVRMRLYTAAGVDAGRVAQAAAFNAGAFVIGMTAFGAAGLWGAPDVAELVRVPSWLLRDRGAAVDRHSSADCHRGASSRGAHPQALAGAPAATISRSASC